MAQFSDNSAARQPAGGRKLSRLLVIAIVAAVVVAAAVAAIAAGWPAGQGSGRGSGGGHQGAVPAGPLPPIPANPLVPKDGDLLGAWVQPTGGFAAASVEASIRSFEHTIGRKLAIDSLYAAFSQPIPLTVARWDLRGGRLPMISWGAVSTTAVASGRYDRKIRAVATELKSLHGPVLLRFFPEMTNGYVRKQAVSGAAYVAAWRHVFRIFKAAGASNVQWVWCPTTQGFRNGVIGAYYPGDAYVNWIAADGYNWGTSMPGSTWRSFTQTFTDFYRWAEHRPKPLMIAEFGSAEGPAGAKGTWLRQAASALQASFPRIKAVVYFNSVHPNFGYVFNWTVTSSRSALAGFRALAQAPYFAVRPALGRVR